MARERFVATAERTTDGWWFLDVPSIGQATQSRRLDDAEAMVRDLVAVTLDVPESTVDVTVELVDIPAEVPASRDARAKAEAAQAEAQAATRRAVEVLSQRGLSTRDVGSVLGLSHQRVSQIAMDDRIAGARANREFVGRVDRIIDEDAAVLDRLAGRGKG